MKIETLIERLIDMRDNMDCAGYDVVIQPGGIKFNGDNVDPEPIQNIIALEGETQVRLGSS